MTESGFSVDKNYVALNNPVITDNVRLSRLYISYLQRKGFEINYEHSHGVNTHCKAINSALIKRCKTSGEADDLITTMLSDVNKSFLNDSAIEWLNGSDKTCFIAWAFIRRHSKLRVNKYEIDIIGVNDQYSFLNITENPTTHEEAFKFIVHFMDFCNYPLSEKRQIIESIKELITNGAYFFKKLNFINEDDTVCVEWSWNYIADNDLSLDFIRPLNNYLKFHSVFSFIVLWDVEDSKKELFLLKMKGAWRQKKLRMDNKNNKLINTYISKESKNMLDELMDKKEVTMKKVLEWAIRSEYNKVFNKK